MNEADKVSANPRNLRGFEGSAGPTGVLHFPDPEPGDHPWSLEQNRAWGGMWGLVLEAGGAESKVAGRVSLPRKIRGCCTRGDWKEHHARAAGFLGDARHGAANGKLCPARVEVPESGRVAIVRPYKCSNERFCPICAVQHAREQADFAARVFASVVRQVDKARGWDARGIDIEWTLPKEFRSLVPWSRHKDFLEACWAAYNATLRASNHDVDEGMGLAIVHPSSSSRPWIYAPHVHMLALSVARKKGGGYTTTRFSLKPDQLVLLKENFRKEFAKRFPDLPRLPKKPVVHYSFFNVVLRGGEHKGKLHPDAQHKFSYTLRSHVEDVRKSLAVADFDRAEVLASYYAKQDKKRKNQMVPLSEFVEGVAKNLDRPKGYHRVRWYGALSNRKKRNTLGALGVEDVEGVLSGEFADPELRDAALEARRDEIRHAEELQRSGLDTCTLCGSAVYVRERGVLLDLIPVRRVFIVGVTTKAQLVDELTKETGPPEVVASA